MQFVLIGEFKVLRWYAESDTRIAGGEVAAILAQNYPFVDTSKRLIVLKWICTRFVETSAYWHLVRNDGSMTVRIFTINRSFIAILNHQFAV